MFIVRVDYRDMKRPYASAERNIDATYGPFATVRDAADWVASMAKTDSRYLYHKVESLLAPTAGQ